jgi:hypothetical protein
MLVEEVRKMNRSWVALGMTALAMTLSAGCSKKSESQPSTGSSGAPTAASAPVSAKTVKFTIDAKGTTTIDMPAPKEHIKADTSAAAGNIDIDPTVLANSRGQVKVDLTTLTTHTFSDDKQNTDQTTHARTWLEAVVDGKTLEDNRWAILTIDSVDGLSAPDVTKVAAVKEGNDDVRTVSMTVHGKLFVHKESVPKDATVEVKFHYPAGAAPESKPSSIDIKTTKPIHIVLKDHKIEPRDPFGTVAQGALHLLGTKVADTADVTVAIKATPAP